MGVTEVCVEGGRSNSDKKKSDIFREGPIVYFIENHNFPGRVHFLAYDS